MPAEPSGDLPHTLDNLGAGIPGLVAGLAGRAKTAFSESAVSVPGQEGQDPAHRRRRRLVVTLKDGRSVHFTGQTARGEIASGERIELDGRRFVGTVRRGGQKRYGQQFRTDGTLEFDGRMFYVGGTR